MTARMRKRLAGARTLSALAVCCAALAAIAPIAAADNGAYGDSDTYTEYYCSGAVLDPGKWCFGPSRHSYDHNAGTTLINGFTICAALHTWDTHVDVVDHNCLYQPAGFSAVVNFSPNYNSLLRPGWGNGGNGIGQNGRGYDAY